MEGSTVMADISEVPGITDPVLCLLHEAGLDTIELLISLEAEEVLARIDQVRMHDEAAVLSLSSDLVKAWQNTGRNLLRRKDEASAAEAKQISLNSLQDAGIDLASVPVARVREEVSSRDRGPGVLRETGLAGRRKSSALSPQVTLPTEHQEANITFQTLESRRDASRRKGRRNRGMSHPDAGLVRWAALVTVVAAVVAILSILGLVAMGVSLLFFRVQVDGKLAFFLLVMPCCLILYILQATRARCRLCGQRLFVPRKCRKHERAERSVLGYTFATARSAVIFASFRCMYCGTKTRLKD